MLFILKRKRRPESTLEEYIFYLGAEMGKVTKQDK